MTNLHRTTYFFQFGLLLTIIAALAFLELSVLQTVSAFSLLFISEMVLVTQQTKMNDRAVYYRKSCLFALGDLSAATAYCICFFAFLIAWVFEQTFVLLTAPIIVLFAYTFLRKIYIFKNYTYEK